MQEYDSIRHAYECSRMSYMHEYTEPNTCDAVMLTHMLDAAVFTDVSDAVIFMQM